MKRCTRYVATVAVTFVAVALVLVVATGSIAFDARHASGLLVIGAIGLAATASTVLCRKLRDARRDSERNQRIYHASFHASPMPLVLSNLETGACVASNEAYTRLTGWTAEEMIGRTPSERGLTTEAERETVRRALRDAGQLREVPVAITRKDGERRDVLLSSTIVVLDGTKHGLTTLVDLTAQIRVEERFRELADAIDEVFWLADVDFTRMIYVSPAFECVFGMRCAAVYAAPLAWLAVVHPDDRDRVAADPRKPPDQRAQVLEFRIVRPDGVVRWIRARSFLVRDERGVFVRHAGVATDITQEKQLERELHHAQRMESLGRLAGGVAHDFNNILAVFAANCSMLATMLPETGEGAEMIGEMEHAVKRAEGLTRQLLAFSRKQLVEPVVVDLNAAVTETRKMLRRMIGEDIALETSLEPDLARVKIDPGHLVQVLMNLAVNARDAMPGGGTLTIETRSSADARVALVVRDTGCGMPPEVLARAFEPFFTTKPEGKGTGMGLAVVHGIVDQAGGRVEIESTVGAGTTFRIVLPASHQRIEASGECAHAACRGVETVLVVDDDRHVLKAACRALRASGYNALEATNASHALRVLGDHDIHLLVTDVVMPGMNGRELVEVAAAAQPELKVLYTTGYTEDEVLARGVSRGEVELLQKPYRATELVQRVRSVLDGREHLAS